MAPFDSFQGPSVPTRRFLLSKRSRNGCGQIISVHRQIPRSFAMCVAGTGGRQIIPITRGRWLVLDTLHPGSVRMMKKYCHVKIINAYHDGGNSCVGISLGISWRSVNSGVAVLKCKFRNPLTKGCVVGAFYGATLYMFVPAKLILKQFSLIAQDGIAYWGILMLPVLFLGLPLLIIGAVIGLVLGILNARKLGAQR